MLILDSTSKSIQAVMSGTPTTTNPGFVTSYSDNTGTTFTEGSSDGALNGVTTVTLVAAPAASTRRIIKTINIENCDTAAVTITVYYNNASTLRVIAKITLQVGDTWTTDGTFDTTGALKSTVGTVNLSNVTGVLTTTNGGTGQSTYTAGDTTYYASGTALTKLGIGTSTFLMTSTGTAPQWSNPTGVTVGTATTATNVTGGAAGSLVYQSGTSATTTLGLGTTNYVLTAGASAPQYVAQSTLAVGSATTATTATNVAGGTIGAVPYQSGAGATTFLSGNTGTTPQFVTSTGTGSAAQAPTLTTSTGSGSVVLATSPTLVTPTLGVASATTVNKVTLTAPATGSTLTVADGKTLTASNSITLAGTDSTTMTFPTVSSSVGYLNIPINSQSAAYTTVLADSGKAIFHPSTDANARTFTIDSNANVAYALGTAITFINMTSQVVTIAITTDTMYLAGTGTTGSRSLAQYGLATAVKMTTTTWIISGSGLT